MAESPVDLFHLFLFVLPGFMFAWSYRRLAKLPRPGDFEYFGQSVFFGLVLLVLIQGILGTEKFVEMIGNPYSAALVLSIFAIAAAWAIHHAVEITDDIRQNWRPVAKWLIKKISLK